MTDDRRRFPWANAHRIADDHDREVSELETAGFGDMAAAFPNGIVYMDGMQNPPPHKPTELNPSGIYVPPGDPLAPAIRWRVVTEPRNIIVIHERYPSKAAAERAIAETWSTNVINLNGKPVTFTAEPDLQDAFTRARIFQELHKPRPWRWWRDPLVIGAAIGVAVLLAIFLSVVP